MYRQVLLAVGNRPHVVKWAQRYGMGWGASRFVAGTSLEEVLSVAADLLQRKIQTTVDILGESVLTEEEADRACDAYLRLIQALPPGQHVSVKLSMMGLEIHSGNAYERVRRLVAYAAARGGFVRIDMEDSRYTAVTLEIFQKLWDAYPNACGTVLQAYLHRTSQDLQDLSLPTAKNFRLVKGAYLEPEAIAYQRKAEVDQRYWDLIVQSLTLGNYTAIATHDERLIERIWQWIDRHSVPPDRWEFQMLYGVKMSLLESLARAGCRTRVYVPYGKDWYAYYLRRIAERPANLLFFLKNLRRA
ncbi:MAG: proline dehydrogenase family protein [Firmicutes bacterium]|nr:proline dehydrogenase family protein [Bacillota bacterium]